MRVLVTGAVGFIGSHLCERLCGRGDQVIGVDNFDETLYPAAIKERTLAELLRRPGFRFVRADFVEPGVADQLLAERPDLVAHLGALAGVRPSLAQPLRYQRTNVEGTLRLLEATRAGGVERFLFASSSSVYGSRAQVPFREDNPADRPASPYAATKRAGELLLAAYADLYGWGATALRFFTVYGPRGRPEMAIASFARKIAAGEEVPFFGDGSSSRDYTYIDDIIDGVVAALDRCQPGAGGLSIYNLGNSRPVTLARLVELLETAIGKRARLRRLPAQPGDVPRTAADLTLAGRELGYAPKVTLEEGLRRTLSADRSRNT
ncbi:MAG TPA: NAD-dependent epimerase/dehydratase family protein [Polyangia bacterium]|nr:NAD-dependent epimerase/dehydratase family protein [Polyangia bacterium]